MVAGMLLLSGIVLGALIGIGDRRARRCDRTAVSASALRSASPREWRL